MVTIYILSLTDGRYYVGKTNNISMRIEDHISHKGSEWTKKYHPISVYQIHENCDPFDEDKYTLLMMSQYGIANVRGGSYCRISLDEDEIRYIKRSINGAQNLCFKCGSSDHWIRDCPLQVCTRCGRNNHTADSCYAKTHIDGKSLDIDISSAFASCRRCGRGDHNTGSCYAKTHIDGHTLSPLIPQIENECCIL